MKAYLAWGQFKPVVDDPTSWVNETVATSGQLWDIGYRFAQPPTAIVQIRQVENKLWISAAGSAVTITTSGRCVLDTPTPAVIQLPTGGCAS